MAKELQSVVLVGRPNVGKSTLFNRIAGVRRAIVAPMPGTTRDVNSHRAEWAGVRFTLTDTGGMFGASEDPLHDLVSARGRKALDEAAVVVFVADAVSGALPAGQGQRPRHLQGGLKWRARSQSGSSRRTWWWLAAARQVWEDLLQREHEAYLKAAQTDPYLRRARMFEEVGTAILVLILTIGIAAYSTIYQQLLQRPTRTLALALLMLAVILCSRLASPVPEFAAGFLITAGMLLAITSNQRFAFGSSGTLAMLVTLACDGDFGLFLTLMAGLSVAVFALREIRTRSKVVGVGLMAAAATLVTSVATNGIEGQPLKYVLEHAAAAGGAVLFAGFIVQGILPHCERLFGIATSMTLLEWCDASQPLLRRLAQLAPGTYSHSLILSQLCEEAAVAIGGNGLLARVGALYHDIGKAQKPDYFVENQEAQMSRHDRLSPTMSLLIITGHVKDGLEMARAYGLPRVLHQFILEHHGTTIVKYFHHAASEAAAKTATGKHDREVAESEFRYPGPKPGTPESAILMLCDGCEGAVRAIAEPTPGRIESTVHQVVMARLTDGQFDNCDITLKDLRTIEQSIVKSLCAIHHGRIKYPGKDAARKPKPEGAERPVGKAAPTAEAGAAAVANGPLPPAAESSVPSPAGRRGPAPEVARQA